MTQEKKIKEAKRLYETANADQRYVLEILFPELAESEDERIRKMLIEFFGKGAECNGSTNGISDKDILAWLERQGEEPIGIRSRHTTGKLAEIIKDIESADKIEALRTEYEKDRADAFAEMQVAWSEDDKAMLKETLALIETVEDINKAEDGFLSVKMWLKSLKQRIGG